MDHQPQHMSRMCVCVCERVRGRQRECVECSCHRDTCCAHFPPIPPLPPLYINTRYNEEKEAASAIRSVDNFWLEGRCIRYTTTTPSPLGLAQADLPSSSLSCSASFGTTKYCNQFLRGQGCNNPECLYLHSLGEGDDSFTKVGASRSVLPPTTPSKAHSLMCLPSRTQEEMQSGRTGFLELIQPFSGPAGQPLDGTGPGGRKTVRLPHTHTHTQATLTGSPSPSPQPPGPAPTSRLTAPRISRTRRSRSLKRWCHWRRWWLRGYCIQRWCWRWWRRQQPH